MRYKPGDMVIKTTGGNKMSICESTSEGVYKCIWCSDNKVQESTFTEEEIVPIDEYHKVEARHSKINQILK